MAKIKPFRAIIYNREKISDLSKVVCPPYDVVSCEEQEHYHDLSPYNFLHILLGKDAAGVDKYRRAKNYFKGWLKDKILVRELEPAIYFYSQQYIFKGQKMTRLGFISLLHISDENSNVYCHEHTRFEPKEDRLRLLKQVKANLSPILVTFLDKNRVINYISQRCLKEEKPFIEVQDKEKTVHKLWRISDRQLLDRIQQKMKAENIFIADGHHRYEVACAYRDRARSKLKDVTGEEDFNYIMAYFTNTDPHGLTILPVHRLLKLNYELDTKDFFSRLSEYFEMREIKEKSKLFFLMEKSGRSEHVLGIYRDKRYWLVRLKNIKILDKLMQDRPESYRSLDVSILNRIIFNRILGIDIENKELIKFSSDAEELISEADSRTSCTVFFLNPVKIQQVISVSSQGERMPPKSTYFYPKVLSGLVINKLDV